MVNIIDVNRLGQSQPTMYQHDLETYKKRCEAFGWHTIVVDGHDVSAIINALNEAETVKDKPTCLIAQTFKGKFFPAIEDNDDWHGKPLGKKAMKSYKLSEP